MSAPAALAPDVAAGYARLRAGAPTRVAVPAALIRVEGPDAASFLHGLLSADVTGLARGDAAEALLLDAKGHVLFDLGVHRDAADGLTLLVAPEHGDGVAGLLERYHFSEDLELLGPEEATGLVVVGAPRPPGPWAPGPLPDSVLVVVDDPAAADGLPAESASAEALEMARIAAGRPRVGRDTGPTTLVQEAGLDERAVSWTKGCYLGQETVARLRHRGRANRALRGLRLDDPADPGTPVTAGDREAGRLTSVAMTPDLGPIGLAILRREIEPGDVVNVGATRARVVALPFGDA